MFTSQDAQLIEHVARVLRMQSAASGWCVAFSGGLDSTVLTHILSVLRARDPSLPPIRAVHIQHDLQAIAADWPEHCRHICQMLDMPLQVIAVQVNKTASLEQAARDARYRAFIATLQAGETLLTAQHRDDQAETLLFRWLRGAGVHGLSGMPEQRELGVGQLFRPLLGCSREQLHHYAQRQGLQWIEDPSNGDLKFSRNYLRHSVMPKIIERWPHATHTMARNAEHLREAQSVLDDMAQLDLALANTASPFAWLELPSLALVPLKQLSAARQRNLLRYWLRDLTRLPDTEHWASWNSLRDAASGNSVWRLADGEVRSAAGRVWWLPQYWASELSVQWPPLPWLDSRKPLALPGNGVLRLTGSLSDAPLPDLHIRYRQGGEILSLPQRGHRDLKRLLNESGLPSFIRGRLPLLYQGERLLAVANLPALHGDPQSGWALQWAPFSGESYATSV